MMCSAAALSDRRELMELEQAGRTALFLGRHEQQI
jgi:hypothetical protein